MTPAQRITFWAENFHQHGIYPIVVTRAWNQDIKTHQDTKRPLGEKVVIEKYSTHEVHYLPFKPGILDWAYLHLGEGIFRPIFLLVKVLDVLFARFTLAFTSFSNFLPYLSNLIQKENPENMIISGEPFYLFRLGYQLNKRNGISWIADYRDDWTTNELQMEKGGSRVRKWIASIETSYEKKWVGTSEQIISVSEPYTKRISDFLNLPGITVQNGFEESLLNLPEVDLEKEFTIMYSGVVYPSQDLKVILGALELAFAERNPFRLIFLGAGFDVKEKRRIEALVPSHLADYVEVTSRFPRAEAIRRLQKAHVLLGMAYGNMKGIPSSKLYEYLALGKPVLLCPTDEDLMEKILSESSLGFFAKDSKESFLLIKEIRTLYDDSDKMDKLKQISRKAILPYSRENQLKILAKHLGN